MFDLESVKELFKTEPNTAFFWSGLGKNGAEIAKEVAKSNGGVTLEMLMEQNKQKLIEAGFPYDEDFDRFRLCEKISVNSTTVIKNDIVGRLEKQLLNFFTVYNKYRNLSSFFNSQSAGVEHSGMEAD